MWARKKTDSLNFEVPKQGKACNLFYLSFWMTENGRKKSQLITFRQGMRMVMSHEPYVKLVIGFLFTSLAFMVTLTFSICL